MNKAEEILEKYLPNSGGESMQAIVEAMKEIAESSWDAAMLSADNYYQIDGDDRIIERSDEDFLKDKEQFINQLFNKEDNG